MGRVSSHGPLTGASDLLLEVGNRYRRWFDRKVLGRKLRKPWMRRRELVIIEEVIRRLAPRRCLEWGAGHSTLYLSSLIPPGAHWTSIEHNESWARSIAESLSNPDVEVRWVPAPPVRRVEQGEEAPFRDYIDAPHGRYDFILVDGRARAACLGRAVELLEDDGVVILHDANRPRYHHAFAAFPKQVSFLDWRADEGGLWLGSKRRELDSVVDVNRHRRLWRLVGRVGRPAGL